MVSLTIKKKKKSQIYYGTFGSVYIIEYKKTGEQYAAKISSKPTEFKVMMKRGIPSFIIEIICYTFSNCISLKHTRI